MANAPVSPVSRESSGFKGSLGPDLYFLAQFRFLTKIGKPLNRQVVLTRSLDRVCQPAYAKHQVVPEYALNVPDKSAPANGVQEFNLLGFTEQLPEFVEPH